jgi:4-oxalmesaconate hydratase
MIIDCHGHYTTSPRQHEAWRGEQIEAHKAGKPPPRRPKISDDEIRESIANGQLKVQRERGTDLTIFSPPAWVITLAMQRPARPGPAPATS